MAQRPKGFDFVQLKRSLSRFDIKTFCNKCEFVLLDNANGVMLAQQAVVGDERVIMRNAGNRIGLVGRHSTVCSGVCLGPSAKLLANLNVGRCECVVVVAALN